MTIYFGDSTNQATATNLKETFDSPCDGSTIALPSGNLTVGNVTSKMGLTTSYQDVPGSTLSYTPPSGTLQVIYRFQFHVGRGSDQPILHVKFYVDGNWAEHARFSVYSKGSSFVDFTWGINIGGSTTHATGRVSSWSSAKTLKLTAREYNSDNQASIHETQHWDGSGSDEFVMPLIGITALG